MLEIDEIWFGILVKILRISLSAEDECRPRIHAPQLGEGVVSASVQMDQVDHVGEGASDAYDERRLGNHVQPIKQLPEGENLFKDGQPMD